MREGNVLTSVCQEFVHGVGACMPHMPPRHACPPWAHMPPSRYYKMQSTSRRYASYWNVILLLSTTKLRRLCFNTCLSVILFMGGSASVHAGIPPLDQTPLDQAPPWDQALPRGPGTPPADGYCCGRYASYWNAFLFTRFLYWIRPD